jgi:hypothetical protein
MANVRTQIQFVDPPMFEEILNDIRAGTSTYKILKERNIRQEAFYSVLGQSAEASERYARAKFDGLERMADDIVAITEDEERDVDRAKLQVDTRKWLLSKLAPKRYGDLLHLQHSGSIDLASELEAARKRAKSDDKSE